MAIPDGVLRGTISDTSRQAPLSYALVTVVGADRRVFANEAGRFAIAGLGAGPDRIRIQQIGYAPVEIGVVLVARAADSSVVDQLVVAMGARVQVLPDLIVTADAGRRTYRQPKGCRAPTWAIVGAGAQLVVDQAVTNADRIRAVERDYPIEVDFEHLRELLDSADRVLRRWVDTVAMNPARRSGYRRGKVLPVVRRYPLARPQPRDAVYFTAGDLARDEFQGSHCVWYRGPDSTDLGLVYRLDFEPAPGIKTADWAGSLQFDRETFQLVRSDAWLVGADPRRHAIGAARCAVRYGGEIPTIVHEQVARCYADPRLPGSPITHDAYRAIATRFLRAKPGDPR
ncbi:MAG: carboxypeptidase-like regulatory domain-containing protein [Gemmatimonadales bacterium]